MAATSQQVIRWPHFPFVHGETLPESEKNPVDANAEPVPAADRLKLGHWVAVWR